MAKDASGHRLGTKLRNTSLPLCIFFSIYTVCYIIIIILNPSMKINGLSFEYKIQYRFCYTYESSEEFSQIASVMTTTKHTKQLLHIFILQVTKNHC